MDLDDRDARRENGYASYSNNVDDFGQVVASLTSERSVGRFRLSNTAYYVDGEGFFEEFAPMSEFFQYGFDPIVVIPDSVVVTQTDLVRRRWLVNHYWGLLPQARARFGGSDATFGLGFRRYAARHFGEVVWTDADVTRPPLDRYYEHHTGKTSVEAYGQVQTPITRRAIATLALQVQAHRYDFRQKRIGNFRGYEFEADHDFVSPRLGVRVEVRSNVALRGLVSLAEREPSSNDYLDEDDPSSVPAFEGANDRVTGLHDPIVKPERLVDVEIATELTGSRWSLTATAYQLEFRDQLIPIDGGRIEAEGRLDRANADRTRHQGIELEATLEPARGFRASGNVTLARHRFVDHEIFAYWLDDQAGGLLRLDGNTIPRNPSVLANLAVSCERSLWRAGAQLQHVGKQYVEGENIEALAIDPYTVVNVNAALEVGELLGTTPVTLEARLLNAFDGLYETFGYSYYDGSPARPLAFYWPAATRSVFASLSVRF
jgi:iron complex outermembrane receptor protein